MGRRANHQYGDQHVRSGWSDRRMTSDTFDTDSIATDIPPAGLTFSNGDLTVLGGSNPQFFAMTLEGKKTGKWYVEFHVDVIGAGAGCGVQNSQGYIAGNSYLGGAS